MSTKTYVVLGRDWTRDVEASSHAEAVERAVEGQSWHRDVLDVTVWEGPCSRYVSEMRRRDADGVDGEEYWTVEIPADCQGVPLPAGRAVVAPYVFRDTLDHDDDCD